MMVALLLYGYCQGERSSRVTEKRCVRDVGYREACGAHGVAALRRARVRSARSALPSATRT
jgi:transposase